MQDSCTVLSAAPGADSSHIARFYAAVGLLRSVPENLRYPLLAAAETAASGSYSREEVLGFLHEALGPRLREGAPSHQPASRAMHARASELFENLEPEPLHVPIPAPNIDIAGVEAPALVGILRARAEEARSVLPHALAACDEARIDLATFDAVHEAWLARPVTALRADASRLGLFAAGIFVVDAAISCVAFLEGLGWGSWSDPADVGVATATGLAAHAAFVYGFREAQRRLEGVAWLGSAMVPVWLTLAIGGVAALVVQRLVPLLPTDVLLGAHVLDVVGVCGALLATSAILPACWEVARLLLQREHILARLDGAERVFAQRAERERELAARHEAVAELRESIEGPDRERARRDAEFVNCEHKLMSEWVSHDRRVARVLADAAAFVGLFHGLTPAQRADLARLGLGERDPGPSRATETAGPAAIIVAIGLILCAVVAAVMVLA